MKVKLNIGDWSNDGHGMNEYFVYEVNKTVSEIRQAYKDSCKKTSLSFHENNGICTDYEDNVISDKAQEILESNGLDLSKYLDNDGEIDIEPFAELILEFIKLSLPDLSWEEASFKKSESIESINGFWNKELNETFGYGLFY